MSASVIQGVCHINVVKASFKKIFGILKIYGGSGHGLSIVVVIRRFVLLFMFFIYFMFVYLFIILLLAP